MSMLRLIGALVILIVINTSAGLTRNNETVDPSISWFLKYTPLFDLTKIPQIGARCRRDFETFLAAIDELELWALKSEETYLTCAPMSVTLTTIIGLVHDATAKIPSGIFNGNLNQYGDFDQCLSVVAGNKQFQGKYCVAYLQPRSINGTMKDLLKLVQSHEFFTSNFDDVRLL